VFAGLQNVLGVAVALAVVAGTPPATAATRAAEFTLPAPADVDVCAYPSVATLADGRVICVYSGVQKQPAGKMALFATYSPDDGATWSPPQRLLDTPGQHDYDSSIIVIGSRMIVSSTTTPVGEKAIRDSETWAVRSEDDGRTWSKPYQIPMGRRYTSGKTNNGIVLADGTALLGYTWENNLELGAKSLAGEGDMDEVNAALISFDEGRTWTSSEGVGLDQRKAPRAVDAINGLCEPAIVECDDASVYMLCRTGLTQLYETRSTDGGRSWAEAEPAPFVSHNAPAALCKFTGSRSGVLAVWNNSPRDRWPLSVAASIDGCRTWTPPRDIALREGLESSYPCCTQTPDGQLLVVYQQQREGGRDIVGVKFPPEWLFESESQATLAAHVTTTVRGEQPALAVEPPVEVGHFPFMPKPVITPDGTWLAYIIQHEGPGLEATTTTRRSK
jgi:predicted neuraminidase